MAPNPQIIFERARRLYTETIPELIEIQASTGKGWEDAAKHLGTLYMIDAITEDEAADAWELLNAAMLERLRAKRQVAADEIAADEPPTHTAPATSA